MPAIIESFLLSDEKAKVFAERRVMCVQHSVIFKERMEKVVKTRLQIEGGKITVEQELAEQAERYSEELTTTLCAELDSIRQNVLDGAIPIGEGLATYREKTELAQWPTIVLEAEPGESIDALSTRVEELGYVVCENDYDAEEGKSQKLASLGMVHAHVPPDMELVKPLADVDGVGGVFDAERALVAPKPTSVEEAEASSTIGMILSDPKKLPAKCPKELGQGARICVIDSGVDKEHPDLAGRVVAERDFTGEDDPADYMGHGTHCAGIAAGSGQASEGLFPGVAPHAEIMNARIFDKAGRSLTSQMLSAIRWALDNGADVINLSVGQEGGEVDGDSLVSRACNKAAEAGIVVCVSAGNEGPDEGTICPPGDAARAITVGAVDRLGAIADFSSRGPTAAPDRTGPKPNVVAPGVNVASCLSTASSWEPTEEHPQYTFSSGTSMAAPHVAGAAAVLVSYMKATKKGDVGTTIRDALISTAAELPDTPEEAQGVGLIELVKAADWIAKGKGMVAKRKPGQVSITLGNTEEDEPVSLKGQTFQRHFACLGSSGSGKTVACKVICEEFIRQGIPVIAIDPQGDIARMGERGTPESIKKQGVPVEILEQYDEQADVVIWTPASSKGIPLCVNPLNFDFEADDEEVVVHSLSTMADSLCTLIGYDLDKDDGDSAQSFLYMVFEDIYRTGKTVSSFTDLADEIGSLPEIVMKRAANIISDREIRTLTRKLLNLTIGVKGLMFERGVHLDIDKLLGRDDDSGKTRLSVIYLNSLHGQEEKDFFLCQIAEKLYHWMLKNPPRRGQPGGVQAVFYIDEIAKFIPPVRKPACKDALMMLFRQARKYGVSCVIATQSPGDIDYTALDQFGSWNLGQLKARQIKAKIIDFLNAVDPVNAETVVNRLPALQKGNFILLSPDEFDDPVDFKVRWLVTRHGSPLSDDDVAKRTTPEMRQRFSEATTGAALRRGEEEPPITEEEIETYAPQIEEALAQAGSPLRLEDLAEQVGLDESKAQLVVGAMAAEGTVEIATFAGLAGQEMAPPVQQEEMLKAASVDPVPAVAEAPPVEAPEIEPEPEPEPPSTSDQALELLLKERRCMTTAELSSALDASTSTVLRVMNELAEDGLVSKDKMGSSNAYWASEYDLSPQDGVTEAVVVAKLQVPERRARTVAEEGLAGFFSKTERISDTELEHLPLWQVDVDVEHSTGLIFKTTTEEKATLYLHGADGRICTYHPSSGFAFSEVVDEDPLRIRDLDDACTFEERMPSDLDVDKSQFTGLIDPSEVPKLIEQKYIAKATNVRLVLLPYWRFKIQSTDGAKSRELLLDGIVGKPLTV